MLELASVSKSFGGLRATDDVSMTVPEGRIVSLIGPNGAGKTTLFAIASGFLAPDSGAVRFLGQDITGEPPHRVCGLGLVRTFQIVKPFAEQTVRENILVGAHLRHPGAARRWTRRRGWRNWSAWPGAWTIRRQA